MRRRSTRPVVSRDRGPPLLQRALLPGSSILCFSSPPAAFPLPEGLPPSQIPNYYYAHKCSTSIKSSVTATSSGSPPPLPPQALHLSNSDPLFRAARFQSQRSVLLSTFFPSTLFLVYGCGVLLSSEDMKYGFPERALFSESPCSLWAVFRIAGFPYPSCG